MEVWSPSSGGQLMEYAWALVAVALALVLQRALRDALRVPALLRRNYAGRDVVAAGGVVAIGAFVLTVAGMLVVDEELARGAYRATIVVFGFGFVGLVDDVVGTHAERGLRGHLRALRDGRLTTGVAKLVLGVSVAVIATVPFVDGNEARVLEIVVIAGAANVGNLFDLAPARATKVAALAFVPLVACYRPTSMMIGPLCFVAAVVGLVVHEAREHLMLGDGGANALGAVTGLAFAIASQGADVWLWPAAITVVGLNVAGEFVSFSRVIDRVPPLRALDQLGRRR